MFDHKLYYEKLKTNFTCSYYDLMRQVIYKVSSTISEKMVELLKEELNQIDQYFIDLNESLEEEVFIGRNLYDIYHMYFSYDIADKIEEEIKKGDSKVEEAVIICEGSGFKITPKREFSEDKRNKERPNYVWGADDILPIVMDKKLIENNSGFIPSPEELTSIKFYYSIEDYVGEVLKDNLNEEIIKEKKKEIKEYFIDCFRKLSEKDGYDWDNEIKEVLSIEQHKELILKKH